MLFSGIDRNNVIRNNLDKLFLQLFELVFNIESYFYLLLWVVDKTDCTRCFSTNSCNTKLNVLIFSFIQLQFERNSFSFDLHDHFIESIDVKYDVLLVFGEITRSEDNRHLQHIFFNTLHSSFLIFYWNNFNWKYHLSWRNLHIKIIWLLIGWFNWNRSGFSISDLKFCSYRERLLQDKARSKIIVEEWELNSWSAGGSSEHEGVSRSWYYWQTDWSIWFKSEFILWGKEKVNCWFLVFLYCTKFIRYFEEGEGMTCFDGKIEVEISTVFNNKFSFFDLIHKNTSKVDLTFFMTFNGIGSATQENRVRKDISNSFHIDKYGSVSSHNVTIHIIVECLRCFWFKVHLNFYLSLRWDHTTHGFNCQRIWIFNLSSYWFFVKVEGQRYIFHVFNADYLFVFTTN